MGARVNPLPGFHGNSGTVARGGQREPDTHNPTRRTHTHSEPAGGPSSLALPPSVSPSVSSFVRLSDVPTSRHQSSVFVAAQSLCLLLLPLCEN